MDSRTRFYQQRGVGMIEVLITLFILSIGLLGVASMQLVGSFSNKEALSRSQAVMVAQQMSERLRASLVTSQVTDGFIVDNEYYVAGNYNFTGLACNAGGGNRFNNCCLAIPAGITNCQTGQCDAAQIARFDAYQMSCAAVQANPAANIALTCVDDSITAGADPDTCSPGSVQEINVSWPTASWQGATRVANPACPADTDCVVVQVVL